ncbi:hypothetical protein GCM10010413_47000 [Promicromonospora sukumoe]|uniref:Uncharacterized protein n=1 Tax=Promicromonospora sukumoe TaxID=88382 RepID=A0A7W3JCF4_9MICO|nr:hypothetical protein [Promicromonospora sukumoe]
MGGTATALRYAVEAERGPVLRAEAPSAGRNSTFAAFLHTAGGSVLIKGVPDYERLVSAHEHEIQVNSLTSPGRGWAR